MKPRKTNGLTDDEWVRHCVGKHHWSDELSAVAGAIYSIEKYGNAKKLWTYRCKYCLGWHLTSRRQARAPAAVREDAA